MSELLTVTYLPDLLCSPYPLYLLPAGLWYFVCSLQTITPQLKCSCVSKEGTKKVFSGTVGPTSLASFTTKNDNYSESSSCLADVSQLKAMKNITLCKFPLCTDENNHTHHKLQRGRIFSLKINPCCSTCR